MGTSSTTTGPVTPDWTIAKSTMTKIAKGTTGSSIEDVIEQAATALINSEDSSVSDISVASSQTLFQVLADATQANPMRNLTTDDADGIHNFVAQSLNRVAPDTGTIDEQLVRHAVSVALRKLAESTSQQSPISNVIVRDCANLFINDYISGQISNALSKSLTENASAHRAKELSDEIHNVVRVKSQPNLSGEILSSTEWEGEEGAASVKRMFSAALTSITTRNA